MKKLAAVRKKNGRRTTQVFRNKQQRSHNTIADKTGGGKNQIKSKKNTDQCRQ